MKNTTGWRFAAAFAVALLALTAGTVMSAALAADSEPDFLVLNPEGE